MVISKGGTNDYRYGYQGQYSEKDAETDWNAFELRMYDSRIGRWLQIDPYGEFASSYTGMGNDPANLADPDGGCVKCPDRAKVGDRLYENGRAFEASIIQGEAVWAELFNRVVVRPNYLSLSKHIFDTRWQEGEPLVQPEDDTWYLDNVEVFKRFAEADKAA